MSRLLLQSIALLGLAWSAAAGAQPADPIVVAVSKTPLSLPLYVAEREGYFAAEGVPVRLAECVGGHRCLGEVVEGRAELASAGDAPIMFRSFATTEFRVLATLATTGDDLKIMARSNSSVTRPRHLEGRSIGVVRGTSSQYFLDSFLLLHGVDPKSVNTVAMQPEDASRLLGSGKVDVISIWEPFGYQAVSSMKGAVAVLPTQGVYTLSWNLVAGQQALRRRGAQLVPLLRAIRRAEAFIQVNPLAAQAILRERMALDQRFIDWVWPGMRFRLTLDQALIKTLESQARWAVQEGHVAARQPPNYLEFIDERPLKAVDAAAVNFVR